MNPLQARIEERLATAMPAVEVLLVESSGPDTLRVFIDHPDGVTLALCEQVTRELAELREQHSLEVSSPGRERPLTKPDHFRRFVGRRARVRVRTRDLHQCERIDAGADRPRRSFTGELVSASDVEVTLAADGGIIAIPYAAIQRSHLVEE
jgi:ribosome maturation factor RimP